MQPYEGRNTSWNMAGDRGSTKQAHASPFRFRVCLQTTGSRCKPSRLRSRPHPCDPRYAPRSSPRSKRNRTYSVTDQIADWGAALLPGAALTIRVAQLSPSLGRGTSAETTVTIT